MRPLGLLQLASVAVLACPTGMPPAAAQDATMMDSGTMDKESADKVFPAKRPYSPWAGRNFPTRPLFGDTHTHTSFSMDAGAFGARLGPREAYRFGKGEEVMASSGQLTKLSRPLDFQVVTDHSDNMGFFPDLLAGKPEILADPLGRKWYDMMQSGKGAEAAIEIITAFGAGKFKGPILYLPELGCLSLGMAGDHRRRGGGERAWPLHRLHRLRVDLEYRRQQSASQRHLSRQWGACTPGGPLHGASARERQSARPVEMDGGL